MKKLFLLLAFTGIVGAASANTFLALSKATVTVIGDDKKSDDKKKGEKSCNHDGKAACCKKGEAKSCNHDGKAEGKSEGKAESKAADTKTETPAKK